MLFLIKDRKYLEYLNELISLKNQVQEVRLQDKLGEQNYHEHTKKFFKPMTDVLKNTSENIAKTLTEKSNIINKAIENLTEKILELMNDRGMIAPYLASFLVNLFKPENRSQFRLKKDLNSTKMYDFLINGGIPVTLVSIMLTFRDTNKSFKLDGDLLEKMTNYDFKVSHSSPKDKKLLYEFAKEMNFNIKERGRKSDRDKEIIKILKSLAVLAYGFTTVFSSENPDEVCDRLRLLLQEIQAGNNSDLINMEIFVIVDKLLEYKCLTKKQRKQILKKCNLIHKQVYKNSSKSSYFCKYT